MRMDNAGKEKRCVLRSFCVVVASYQTAKAVLDFKGGDLSRV